MRSSLYLFLLAVLLNGCLMSPKKEDLKIPDAVAVEKTGKHVQVPGTHLFMIPPKGISFLNSFVLRLARNAEIRLEEKMTSSFQETERDHLGEFISQLNDNPFQSTIQYHKKFKLGKDSASLVYGKDRKNHRDEILMAVGGDLHSVLIYCTLPENQPALLQEMLAAIKTVYIDPDILVDYESSAPFSMDVPASPFTINLRKNGLVDYACFSRASTGINKIIVKPGLPFNKEEELNYAVESHKKTMTDIHIQVEKAPNKKVFINGYRGVESIFRAHFPKQHVLRGEKMVYLLYLSNENCSLLYSCYIDAAEKDVFKAAKDLAHTIRLK